MGQELSHQIIDSEDAETTYQRYRKLAGEEAKLRNECFAQSQLAYKSRQGEKAKVLSQKGKEHSMKMEQYNMKAVEVIFRGIISIFFFFKKKKKERENFLFFPLKILFSFFLNFQPSIIFP